VKLLGRHEVTDRGQRGHNGRSLLGGAFHTTSLVVVFDALDVDVIVVVFDAMFAIQFLVNLLSQPWQEPTLEDDTVEECDEDDVENNLPENLSKNVGRVKGDGKDFVPKGKGFFVCLSGELIDNHSHNLALLRMIVNY
jgi:hypothetical protein